ncbi:hypothetical protein SAMN05216490_0896 [Mucilaginibacter mallensis]|uniref:Uncharacterized protein n=1 Tax=Mucilaginibacter mallensis TaxID=652787 RepID=A0A1H1R1Q8_MUCMA|nr:hypothetical protein SAMN05216490_0896 [Mucilaginibacter mallensis]
MFGRLRKGVMLSHSKHAGKGPYAYPSSASGDPMLNMCKKIYLPNTYDVNTGNFYDFVQHR